MSPSTIDTTATNGVDPNAQSFPREGGTAQPLGTGRTAYGYRIPAGRVQTPFVYVFDARNLADGSSPADLAIGIQGNSAFRLRSIWGDSLCLNTFANGGLFNWQRPSQANAISGNGLARAIRRIVAPEVFYPPDSQIGFNLANVLRDSDASGANPVFKSFIAFQGVREYSADSSFAVGNYQPSYRYYEYPYVIVQDIEVGRATVGSNAGPASPPVTTVVEVNNYDFELCEIIVVNRTTDTLDTTNSFAFQLYDASGFVKLSDNIIPSGFYNAGFLENCFPTPSLVYPVNSLIQLDITSLIHFDNALPDPAPFTLYFRGFQRKPC